MKSSFLQYKITYTLIVLNILGYILTSFYSQNIIDMDIEVLVHMGAIYGPTVVLYEEWWRLITAMFLHGGMTHLLMNMFSLYLIGRGVEQYFDTKSYLSLYFVSGIVGSLVSIVMHPVSIGVGASGAIFGIFAAMAGFFMAHREQIEEHTKGFMKSFGLIIGLNLVIGFFIPAVDVSAHVGGLVAGFIGGYMISRNLKWFMIYNIVMIIMMLMIAYYLTGQYVKPTLFS